MQFFVDAPEVGADGVDADVELVGNLFVGEALGQAVQDGGFAGGKVGQFFAGLRGFLKRGDDFAGNGTGHGRAAAVHFANGGDHAVRLAVELGKHRRNFSGGEIVQPLLVYPGDTPTGAEPEAIGIVRENLRDGGRRCG